jgi:hypothetical protein
MHTLDQLHLLQSLSSRPLEINRWLTQAPIPVEAEGTLPLSVMFVTFPDDRETACRSRLSELYGKPWVENPVGPRVRTALWTSAGRVSIPLLAVITDDLQLEIRGETYDDGSI